MFQVKDLESCMIPQCKIQPRTDPSQPTKQTYKCLHYLCNVSVLPTSRDPGLICRTNVNITVLVIIKQKYFPDPVRFQSGSDKLKLCRFFYHVLPYFRTLYIVWSLVRRRVIIGVSPGSKLCSTFLNIAKYLKMVHCGCGSVAVIF